jgi:zinc protease
VGTDDIHAVARELVRPDDALILVVGDAAKVRDELADAGLGPLEVAAEA